MVTLGYVFERRLATGDEYDRQVSLAVEEANRIREQTVLPHNEKVSAGENFKAALLRFGLSAQEAANASAAAQRAFNLRQLRAGSTITVGRSVEGELREIDYKIDPERILKIVPEQGGFTARISEIPSKTEIVAVTGKVEDSLFNAVEDAGESAELALRLAQILSYDLDFYTDLRQGDTFRILLEKKRYVNGETAGYGKIYAAEYENAGRKYQALLFRDPAGRPGYYTADGKSLQKAFLRSPLKFGAPVTSHFSRSRFHPILKIYRPHMVTDYGAPVGTPVQTIGSGRVVFAGRNAPGTVPSAGFVYCRRQWRIIGSSISVFLRVFAGYKTIKEACIENRGDLQGDMLPCWTSHAGATAMLPLKIMLMERGEEDAHG